MKYLHFVFLDCRVFSNRLSAIWLLVTFSFGAGIANADDVVVPNALESTEGNTRNCIPLTGCLNSHRYLQVFASSEFGAPLPPGPHFITEMSFRPDIDLTPLTSTSFADIEINLSTTSSSNGPDTATPVGPDNLFERFDDNFDTDKTNVYRGALTLSSSVTGPAGQPKDFDIVIKFQTPFLYDPSLGHLLFEWKNRSGEDNGFSFVDAEDITGDSISRITSHIIPGDPGDPDSEFGNTTLALPSLGLITKYKLFLPEELVLEDVPTPTGSDVPVVNVPDFFTQVADVITPGITSADFCVGGPDPRERGIKKGKDRFQQRYLNVSELSGTGSCGDLSEIDLRIAPWFRGYPGIFDDTVGVWFVVASVRSTAEYLGPVEVETFPEALIDFTDVVVTPNPPECNTDLEFRELTLGGAVAAFGDHPNTEGTRMIPETVLCNSERGLTRRTAHVYPVRLDAKSNQERINVQWQLNGIEDTIAEASLCVDVVALPVIALLQSSLDSAHPAVAQGRYADAQVHLEQIARDAKDNSNNFSGCPADRNYVGNFMARGLVAAFTIWDRFLHPDAGVSWAVYVPPVDLDVF